MTFNIHTATNGELRIELDRLKPIVEKQKNDEISHLGHGRAVMENRRLLKAIRQEMERRQPRVAVRSENS